MNGLGTGQRWGDRVIKWTVVALKRRQAGGHIALSHIVKDRASKTAASSCSCLTTLSSNSPLLFICARLKTARGIHRANLSHRILSLSRGNWILKICGWILEQLSYSAIEYQRVEASIVRCHELSCLYTTLHFCINKLSSMFYGSQTRVGMTQTDNLGGLFPRTPVFDWLRLLWRCLIVGILGQNSLTSISCLHHSSLTQRRRKNFLIGDGGASL